MIAINEFAANAHIDYMTKRNGRPIPTLLISSPGMAKSSFVETVMLNTLERHCTKGTNEVPEELANLSHVHWSADGTVACVTEMINMRDAPDLRGFLVPRKDGTSSYTKPDLVALEESLYAAGAQIVVMFFDEMLGADHLTQKALTDVMLNGRFGSYSLDKRTWCVGASNRTHDGAGTNRALSILRNRINTIEIYLPIGIWVRHATDALGLPGYGIAFAKQFPGKLTVDVPPKDTPFPSFRSYTDALLWCATYKTTHGDADPMTLPVGKGNEYVNEKLTGFLGEGTAAEMVAYVERIGVLPTYEEIMADPQNCMVPPLERMDAQYASAQLISHYATSQNAEKLWIYAERLMLELQVSIARDLYTKEGGAILNAPAMTRWIAKNKALVISSLG